MNDIANEKNPPAKGNKRGSLWRRWDLHLHAPGTKLNKGFIKGLKKPTEEIWNKYIDDLEKSPVDVFGITDYFSCDSSFELIERYRKRHPKSPKAFFINIEFRLSESILENGDHAHIHVIFDNNLKACSKGKLDRFLTNLTISFPNDAGADISCSDLKIEDDFKAATIKLDDLREALQDTFGTEKPYLIAFPAGNNGVQSSKPKQDPFIKDILKGCDFLFGKKKNRDFFLIPDPDRDAPKAVVSGSDAHSFEELPRLEGNEPNFPPTWIKADTTFFGLKQICYEPKNRVFIGKQPEVMRRQEQEGTKFIDTLNIEQIPNYDGRNGVWFKDISLSLSPELTAIIGNKGSGKSAIVDIIGLLGESRQENHFSFLPKDPKKQRFKKPGYAENFEATLTWKSKKQDQKNLNDSSNLNKPETVRYLPQNYFEQLTNESDIKTFREEIEKIVFSHVKETDRLGEASFSDLKEVKTEENKQKISSLKQNLRELNFEITRLEEQNTSHYRKQLKEKIKTKQEELEALEEGRPEEVSKPKSDPAKQKEIDKLNNQLLPLDKKIEKKTTELGDLKTNLQSAESLEVHLENLDEHIKKSIEKIKKEAPTLGLNISDIVSWQRHPINISPVKTKIKELKGKIKNLELKVLPDLKKAWDCIQKKIDEHKEGLKAPARLYQNYVEELKKWEIDHLAVCGDDTKPKPDTVKWLVNHQIYIKQKLEGHLTEKKKERKEIVKNIYKSKSQLLKTYRDLTVGIEKHMDVEKVRKFDIAINVSFIINKNFSETFLNYINKSKRGPFRMAQEEDFAKEIQEINWNDFDSTFGFCENIITEMNKNDFLISEQVDDIKEFYDFLFSFDYLSPSYELRFQKKTLNELSPGEKGLLLLIFYLQLDRENTPLVIDQPEDNLDNESVFEILAECIRYARKRRQIILVTHNPNLAIGADAEQIIYVKIDKEKKNKFSHKSGAIENPRLNKLMVKILEGSQPAFIKRRLKYNIN